jgi:hypothetical protein
MDLILPHYHKSQSSNKVLTETMTKLFRSYILDILYEHHDDRATYSNLVTHILPSILHYNVSGNMNIISISKLHAISS